MSGTRHIYVRVALAVVADGRILLVPNFNTDAGPVQWVLPGGQVEFGERLADAATREFAEETGLDAKVGALLHVSEVVRPERPWHSVTVTFVGTVTGGVLGPEQHPRYGEKQPRWFTWEELRAVPYHPGETIDRALGVAKPPECESGERQ